MKALLHLGLLLATFITLVLAGVQWLNRDPLELANFSSGILYGLLMVAMLLAHEMGHYAATRYHKVDATLPFFIPFPSFLFLGLVPFGTLGAVIKMREPVRSRDTLFDIGAAGPIAGAVASVVILIIGFRTLPSREFLNVIHPEYATLDTIPDTGLTFGTNILFALAQELFATKGSFVPPLNEIYHYPFLCVGWFGLFVTAFNLVPVGQLDGGHIVKALFGEKGKNWVASVVLTVLIILGLAGLLPFLGYPSEFGWPGWLLWGVILAFYARKSTRHSDVTANSQQLNLTRRIIGWGCLVLLAITFSPVPFSIR